MLVHPLFGVMCLGLCLVKPPLLEDSILSDNGKHHLDELEFDGIQGLSLYIFIVWSVT